jgi:hypothetical protein
MVEQQQQLSSYVSKTCSSMVRWHRIMTCSKRMRKMSTKRSSSAAALGNGGVSIVQPAAIAA